MSDNLIKVPEERAYFYELSNLQNKLICWIPLNELKQLVKNKNVNKSILVDYPAGLDVEVYKKSFEEFKKNYNLVFAATADALWEAFYNLIKNNKESISKTGYLNAKQLENDAMDLSRINLIVAQDKVDLGFKFKGSKKEKDRVKANNPNLYKEVNGIFGDIVESRPGGSKKLKSFKVKNSDLELIKENNLGYLHSERKAVLLDPQRQQALLKVDMTEGEEPLEAISKFYRHKKKK